MIDLLLSQDELAATLVIIRDRIEDLWKIRKNYHKKDLLKKLIRSYRKLKKIYYKM